MSVQEEVKKTTFKVIFNLSTGGGGRGTVAGDFFMDLFSKVPRFRG
jgi:hypothetical protein